MAEEQFSSGQHQRVEMYGGTITAIEVCDTCINVLGLNIRWDQAHPAPSREETNE